MRKLNRKGFTLIELIATIIILALVMGIGSYAIIGIINNSKEKNYQHLVNEIRSAIETYYMECKYSSNDAVTCPPRFIGVMNTSESEKNIVRPLFVENILPEDTYVIKLIKLVEYGYLKSNAKDEEGVGILVNPRDDVNIGECEVMYIYEYGNLSIYNHNDVNESCPNFDE